ncbi:coumaryl-CoA ligase [Nitzschia inconspicua]|uniref:Coumaryl-CoA ligase n=1 Tax=Nitzschia inconspicua TaxID=303405 RepID=A0A9K3PNR5_9STRA|nr:coumaryl-CoA ligase [Nitzschia inconspicua]
MLSSTCRKIVSTSRGVAVKRVLIHDNITYQQLISLQAIRSISSTSILHDGELAEKCSLNIVTSPFPPISHGPYDPLPEVVMRNWKKSSGRKKVDSDGYLSDELAIYDGSTGMKRTFKEHYRNTKGIAGNLKYELGVDEKACVCLFAPNHVDYLPVTLAVGLCGAKLTPVNPLYKKQELQVVLDRSRSSVLIAHTSILDVALEAARDSTRVKHVIVMTDDGQVVPDGLDSLDSIKRHKEGFDKTERYVHPETKLHPYLLPYSSGTTGMPKGVCLTHANLTANLIQFDVVEGLSMGVGEALLSPLPFFHIYGMVASLLCCGWKGNPLLTMSGRFDFALMLEMIKEYQPTTAHLVPPILLALAKHPIVDGYDMSCLRTIISAAAPLGRDTEMAVQERLGCLVKQAWGMSELSPIGTINSDFNKKTGSVGPLVSNTFGKILDKDGKTLGPNEPGELAIKGPQVMIGYLDDPQKTQECLSSSGWLRTGDVAYYDEEGFFFITDRIKELIKVRGFQVAPAELEELLLGHEMVNDVAVIQIPDEESGELPRAYIVLKEDCEKSHDEMQKEIYGWVKDRVAPHKRLDGGIVFVESIPKSASGKILRRILRDELAEQLKANV